MRMRVAELANYLAGDALTTVMLIGVVVINARQNLHGRINSHVVDEGGAIQVVPHCIATHHEKCLYTQGFRHRRHNERCPRWQDHLFGLQRRLTNQLADTGIHAVEIAKNDLARREPVSSPATITFYCLKHRLESQRKVSKNVVVIKRKAVTSMQCSCGAANKNSIRNEAL